MIQTLLTVVLGFLVMGIICALGVFVGEVCIMIERRIPTRYTTHLDYPILFIAFAFGLVCAWFMGQVTVEVADAVVSGAVP